MSEPNKPDALTTDRFCTFAEFWPFYVREHASRTNRRLHCAGTLAAMLLAAGAVSGWLSRGPAALWWLVAVPLIGYGAAWIGHFVIEKNRPATFRHPLWSLLGDFKMLALTLGGRMDAEVSRHVGDSRP